MTMSKEVVRKILAYTDPFYEEGYQAYQDGEEERDCTYYEGTDAQNGWLKGWRAAKAEEES